MSCEPKEDVTYTDPKLKIASKNEDPISTSQLHKECSSVASLLDVKVAETSITLKESNITETESDITLKKSNITETDITLIESIKTEPFATGGSPRDEQINASVSSNIDIHLKKGSPPLLQDSPLVPSAPPIGEEDRQLFKDEEHTLLLGDHVYLLDAEWDLPPLLDSYNLLEDAGYDPRIAEDIASNTVVISESKADGKSAEDRKTSNSGKCSQDHVIHGLPFKPKGFRLAWEPKCLDMDQNKPEHLPWEQENGALKDKEVDNANMDVIQETDMVKMAALSSQISIITDCFHQYTSECMPAAVKQYDGEGAYDGARKDLHGYSYSCSPISSMGGLQLSSSWSNYARYGSASAPVDSNQIEALPNVIKVISDGGQKEAIEADDVKLIDVIDNESEDETFFTPPEEGKYVNKDVDNMYDKYGDETFFSQLEECKAVNKDINDICDKHGVETFFTQTEECKDVYKAIDNICDKLRDETFLKRTEKCKNVAIENEHDADASSFTQIDDVDKSLHTESQTAISQKLEVKVEESESPAQFSTSFNDLPEEIVHQIFSFCSHEELGTGCAVVCKKWRDYAYDPIHWQRLMLGYNNQGIHSDILLHYLKRAPLLKQLSLGWRDDLTNIEVADISLNCPMLRELDVGFCDGMNLLTIKAIASELTNLDTINLEGISHIDYDCIKQLCRLKKLKVLNVSHCNFIEDDSVELLASSLPIIHTLNIDGIAHITNRLVLKIKNKLKLDRLKKLKQIQHKAPTNLLQVSF